jgi:DNA phosphorothioation-associated DGQHR protein 1
MDNELNDYFLVLPALKVDQPLASFYVIAISARDLLTVSFSEPLRYIDNSGTVKGSQRKKDEPRLKQIATYIDSVEMAFPNSIILGANYTPSGNISKDESERWRILEEGGNFRLVIPKSIAMAAVIDGQHRLNAFQYVKKEERFTDLQLVCSVYFDLPNSYQAFLFATINSNQKKVDRSVALEQFGYNVDDEPEKSWTPEKFAVFLSRKLNIEVGSPFYRHIKVAPLGAEVLFPGGQSGWVVSTATIVDGICNLISSNVKRDRIIMQQDNVFSGRNRGMIKGIKDVSPLRQTFIQSRDQTIFDIVSSFFETFGSILWSDATPKSYIHKTVGVQAGFDILKMILIKHDSENLSDLHDIFVGYITSARNIDFSDKFFQASGIGRSRIKNSIALASGLIGANKIKKADQSFYASLLRGESTNEQTAKQQWDDDAESAVINALEKISWNYDNQSVSLYTDEDFENAELITDYISFISKLESIAVNAFETAVPDDAEFAALQKELFDADDLVLSCLADYEPNLKKLGWISEAPDTD